MKTAKMSENGAVVINSGNANVINTIYLWGNFGGGEVTVDVTPDNSEYFDLIDKPYGDVAGVPLAFSAKGYAVVELKTQAMRFTLAGATAPSISIVVL